MRRARGNKQSPSTVDPMSKKSKPDPQSVEPLHIAPESASAPAAPTSSKINKSEEIRLEARRILDAGGSPRPKDIIESLGRRGIEVVSPQVSQILGALGVERRPRKKKRDTSPPPKPARASTTTTGDSFTLHDLIAAKKFVEMIGSPKRALSLLDALDKIS